MVFSTSELDPGPAGAEQRVHLVEEDDDRDTLGRLLAGSLEDQADVALGLADVLVEQLRTLDVEEVRPTLGLAGDLRDLLGQGVGDRLGDQGLATSGRAVQQDALRRLELVLEEEVGMQVGQLDGVTDLLDLGGEPTDRRVVDVGDLFEHQFLDLGLRDALVDVLGPRLEQQRVAGAQRLVHQGAGQADDAFLVGVTEDEGAHAVLEDLLEH